MTLATDTALTSLSHKPNCVLQKRRRPRNSWSKGLRSGNFAAGPMMSARSAFERFCSDVVYPYLYLAVILPSPMLSFTHPCCCRLFSSPACHCTRTTVGAHIYRPSHTAGNQASRNYATHSRSSRREGKGTKLLSRAASTSQALQELPVL